MFQIFPSTQTEQNLGHFTQQNIREDEKWWQQFNWLMDRIFPATGQEHSLPLEVASTLLNGLILPSNDALRNSTALKACEVLYKSGLSSGRTAELEESILRVGKANPGAERLWGTVILRRISGLNGVKDLKVGQRVRLSQGSLRLDAELKYGDEKYALEFKVGVHCERLSRISVKVLRWRESFPENTRELLSCLPILRRMIF
ncbi:hypothetical protein MHY13_11170 [Corynebacterium sp. ACRPE]|uniref:hypothetical protein n=1 Tax=Corynebacterium sp. ACRPE TaxID=2918196 RepID=UPI001EF412C2|nr:hypothetical protein [Corynebacterium sp. ACRPE]MCG7468670.1 hypothetical protein [Corynebacterium sp. ACRPE]